jgi:acyl-CoA reductase-like NAD-dependent aldehyde dehydrogenase
MPFGDRRLKRCGLASVVPVLLLLSGCGGDDPDCNSADTRDSVIKTVSGDSNNPLVDYAVKNSEALKKKVNAASSEADKTAIAAKARQSAVYRLDDSITTNSKSLDKRTVTCSGKMITTVEGDIVQKQVDFKVERTADGQHSVSVSPFQFDPNGAQ